jgi:hypothetical protein
MVEQSMISAPCFIDRITSFHRQHMLAGRQHRHDDVGAFD